MLGRVADWLLAGLLAGIAAWVFPGRFCRPTLPTDFAFVFCCSCSFFDPLSLHQNGIVELKASSPRLNICASQGFSGLRKSYGHNVFKARLGFEAFHSPEGEASGGRGRERICMYMYSMCMYIYIYC